MTALRIAIIVLFAKDDGVNTRADLETALASSLDGRVGVHRISREEGFVLGGDLDGALRACGSDLACTAKELRSLRVDRALIVVVNQLVQPPLLDLRYVDLRELGPIETDIRPLEARPVRPQVSERVTTLLDRHHPKLGRLRVRTEPPDANVTLEPLPTNPLTSGTYVLSPGVYQVTAVADGHVARRERVEVVPDGDHNLSISLDSEGTLLSSPWFWGAVGVVAVGVVVTGVVVSNRPRAVCFASAGLGCDGM